MHNVECKAELRDVELARAILKGLRARHILTFSQIDTYFRIPHGRLKRRETEGEPAEYIFYERANRVGPKLSHFTIFTEEQAVERFGREPLPVWLTVRKSRELWLSDATRVHLDDVERLGRFIELESLVSKGNNIAKAHDHLAHLRKELSPAFGELIDCGYSDLLEREQELSGSPAQLRLPPGH